MPWSTKDSATAAGSARGNLLWALTAVMAAGPSFNYALSSSAPILIENRFITESSLGLLASLIFLSAGVASIFSGVLSRHLSPRLQSATCTLGASASFLIAAVAPSALLFSFAAVLAGSSQAISNPVTNHLIKAAVPSTLQSRWIGIKQSGVQVSQVVAGFLAPALAIRFGWTTACLVLAAILLAVAIFVDRSISALSTQTHTARPEEVGPSTSAGSSGRPARTPTVESVKGGISKKIWVLTAASALAGFAMQIHNVYFPVFAVVNFAKPAIVGGLITTVIGILGVSSRVFWARLAGRSELGGLRILGRLFTLALFSSSAVLLATAWESYPMYWTGIVLHGISVLGVTVVVNTDIIRNSPPTSISRDSGIVAMGMYFGFATGPFIAGLLLWGDVGYSFLWALTLSCYLVTILILLVFRRLQS